MGAEGSSSSWARPLKFFQVSLISSIEGLLRKVTNTAAVWPSETGTRRHWAVMAGPAALTILPSSTLPQTFRGSCSLFSSSPPM